VRAFERKTKKSLAEHAEERRFFFEVKTSLNGVQEISPGHLSPIYAGVKKTFPRPKPRER